MQIFIKTLDGLTIVLDVEPSDFVIEIKKKYQEKHGTEFELQTLIFNGQVLDDQLTISDCGITKEDTLSLIKKEKGGYDVTIKTMRGDTFNIDSYPGEKVEALKLKISDREGISADLMKLTYAGQEVEDKMALIDFNY